MPPDAAPRKAFSLQLKAGLAITGAIVLLGLLAPWIAPHPWATISMRTRFLPPNATYWFGTDEYGRDVLSRLLIGTRLGRDGRQRDRGQPRDRRSGSGLPPDISAAGSTRC